MPVQADVENSCFVTGMDWGLLDTLQDPGHGTALRDLRLSCTHMHIHAHSQTHPRSYTDTHTQGRMKKSKPAGPVGVTEGL